MEVHRSARKHGVHDGAIFHALERALLVAAIDHDAAPARELVIGPDTSANMLEIVVLRLDDGRDIVIHAMPARRQYLEMLRSQLESST